MCPVLSIGQGVDPGWTRAIRAPKSTSILGDGVRGGFFALVGDGGCVPDLKRSALGAARPDIKGHGSSSAGLIARFMPPSSGGCYERAVSLMPRGGDLARIKIQISESGLVSQNGIVIFSNDVGSTDLPDLWTCSNRRAENPLFFPVQSTFC